MARPRKIHEEKNMPTETFVTSLNDDLTEYHSALEAESSFTQTEIPNHPAAPKIEALGEMVPDQEEPDVEEEPADTAHTWEPIQTVLRNGFPVRITGDVRTSGVIAFWRKSRAFANATHRWEETGFWTDTNTGRNVDFKPLWWKDRNAV